MAEHMTNDTSSWQNFVDRVTAPLRLEPAYKMRFGLVATLTIVAHEWGEINFWRAAERLVAEHFFSIDDLCLAEDNFELRVWFATWLAAHAPGCATPAPHISQIVKPAFLYTQSEGEARR